MPADPTKGKGEMRVRIVVTYLLFLVLWVTGAEAQQASGSAEAEVLATIDRFSQAGLHRDVAALSQLYSMDYFHTNPDGSVISLATVLNSYRGRPIVAFDAARAEEQRVLVHGSLAVVNQKLSLHGNRESSGKFTLRYRITYVLEKQESNWKIVTSHSSLLGMEKEENPAK